MNYLNYWKKFFFMGFLLVGFFSVSSKASAYFDVPENHQFFKAIQYFTDLKVFQGYADGGFSPERKVNRAEFSKILSLAKDPSLAADLSSFAQNCFTDVFSDQWFSSYVCRLKELKTVSGHPDGSFKPGSHVTLAEAAKMTAHIFEVQIVENPNAPWFEPYIKVLAEKKAIPDSVKFVNQELTRSEIAEILHRTRENIADLPAASVESLISTACQKPVANWPEKVDIQKVRDAWLAWHNEERAANGLAPLTYNLHLEQTGLAWSSEAVERGSINHTRSGSEYYNYQNILSWFKNYGLEFQNNTFSESIAWNVYSCSDTDCTDELIQAIRTGFDFFMSEKGKAVRPHYDAIVGPNYKIIGVGVAVDPVKKRFYLTTHYANEITSNPQPICP